MTLRTLNYGKYGIFLIMGNAGFCPSTVVQQDPPTPAPKLEIPILGGSGDLVTGYFRDLLSTITPIRVPFRVLISLLTTYLLSSPTLQVQTL